jgi:hypothetical protein
VSILAEIAQRADVSVEGVLRVLTREPVSTAVKDRVLEVLTDLTPEQTSILQRFALAALHDDLPREESVSAEAAPALSAPASDELEARVAPILVELTSALEELRRETNQDRRERVDDLALLIDVVTTGWQGMDRRLGRVERMLGRLESAQRTPPAPLLVERPREPEPPGPPATEPDAAAPPRRRRWAVAAALVAGVVIGLLAGLDVLPTQAGLPSFAPDAERAASEKTSTSPTVSKATKPAPRVAKPQTTTTRPVGTTTRPTPPHASKIRTQQTKTSAAAPKPAPTPPASSVLGTTASAPTSRPPAAPPPATGTSTGTFTPSRNWGWGPVKGADYYLVRFYRSGKLLYSATPTESSVHLPESVVFPPGSYRWIVQPGFGKPAEKRLAPPVVESTFELPG